ncbi:MAG: flagellar hook-basal body complex protein FliE [Fibrobacterota bacterium]
MENINGNFNSLNGPKGAGNKPGAPESKVNINDKRVPAFKDTLKSFMHDVNHMQNHADRSIEKMVAGEITDVHQVMMAVEEANTSFNLMMEIRTKMLDAYQEIMRMQV